MKYTIIIPAYNEEERIEHTIRDYAEHIQQGMDPQQTELLIVVNGSQDRTGEIAQKLAGEYPYVKAWVSPDRMGKGGAVLKGFELATGRIVAFADADNATPAPELKKLLDVVDLGADAALGSRWMPGSRQVIPQPLMRRIMSRIFNILVRVLFQFPYSDTQCGAKAFRKEALDSIRGQVQATGWSFDVELIWRLRQKGYRVVEVPINWSDNSRSRLRVHSDGPSMLVELLKIRFGG